MNATGLRDQRVRIYSLTNQGTEGEVRSVFNFSMERWARLDDSAAAVRAAQDRLQMHLDAACEFGQDSGTVVPCPGILKNKLTGECWWVRGVYGVRNLRRVVVGLERVTVEEFATFQVFEDQDTKDGTHLVDPASS